MEHLGDITKINGHKIPVVDVMVGGSPCQDLSVAGLRKGLSGERSGLFMEQVRIFKEMRENDIRNGVPIQFVRPRVFIWENVVGALTSGNPKGEDFRIVLEEISKIGDPTTTIPMPKDGKWHTSGSIVADWGTVSWRVHDAQFWGRTYYNEDGSIKHYGTPQRRRRISVIADFSPRGDTNEILFVGKGLPRNTNESRETRKSSTEDTTRSTRADDIERAISFQERSGKDGGGKGILVQDEKLGTFTAVQKQYVCYSGAGSDRGETAGSVVGDHENRVTNLTNLVVSEDKDGGCSWDGSQISPTITVHNANRCQRMPDKEQVNCVLQPLTDTEVYCSSGNNKLSVAYEDGETITFDTSFFDTNVDKAQPLRARDYKDPQCVSYCIGNGQLHDAMSISKELSKTLNCLDDPMKVMVAYGFDQGANRDVGTAWYEETSKTITNGSCPGHHNGVVIKEAVGDDCYNFTTGDKTMAIRSAAADPSHIPCVIEKPKTRYIVRRLLPIETERLQGFPDNWTNIGEYTTANGKKASTSDSSRYKQMGNSIALPFWGWLLNRITIVLKRDNPNHTPTLGSLFDGVGGFPLLWAKINGVDSCLWASEIDESCIAVTKKHFGDKDHRGDIDQFLPFVHIKDD